MPPVTGDDGVPTGFTPASPFGVWGDSGQGVGVIGSSPTVGVQGVSLEKQIGTQLPKGAGVRGDGVIGVAGFTTGADSRPGTPFIGVFGCAASDENPDKVPLGTGVLGLGVSTGVEGRSLRGAGVVGHSGLTGVGVVGDGLAGAGVMGRSGTAPGVLGFSQGQVGILGQSVGPAGVGVRGECTTPSGTGVIGIARATNSVGVIGIGGRRAAVFSGDVDVTGHLTKGGGGFAIDHPLDPEGRFLSHSFVESPERKNLYDGIVSCGDTGEAIVDLPAWFEPLNCELRYQLTPLGRPAPDLHVAAEVTEGRFRIAGGAPGLRVSWQVTGVRQDAWARSNPLTVEEDKAPGDQGYFLHPEAHGHAIDRGIHRAYYEQAEANPNGTRAHNSSDQAENQQP